ncbi:hypothetical protein [Nocardiopsis aegyptia]|uniref:Uncharacterized protein n=1 Tax=Nocardiopsis aegyptia TaxID=220378 RepID=A0A7Z0JB47_9ACTN|nr:hypothetical protein [Nocardiopsis aegyptia]NYJ35851.1 hypothetical protein [Nocardiopsis aegyptia]
MAGLVIAAVCSVGVLLLLVTPPSHHLGSHEPSPCHPVVPLVFHPGDPLFHNERLDSWTRDQCALARQERAVTALLVSVPAVVPVAFGVCGALLRRPRTPRGAPR